MLMKTGLRIAAAALIGVTAGPVFAAPYSAEYVFGDSLSDRGNLAETGFLQQNAGLLVTSNFPNPPSNHDSFTNGPVAVQVLAQSLGLNADPSLFVTGFADVHGLFGGASYQPGTNYAVAGATAAASPPVAGGVPGANLPQQIATYSAFAGGVASSTALYVVFAGGNDVRNAALNGTGVPAVTLGVTAETTAIATLAAEGARNFLVVNVPDVGVIPEFATFAPTLAPSATAYSQDYDAELAAGLAGLTLPAGTKLTPFDLYGFNMQILAAINGHGLPITDTTDPCFTNTPLSAATTAACGPNGANINSLYYWDAIHPTGQVQALWGEAFAQALAGQTPTVVGVPAPGASAALVACVVGFLARRRRVAV